MNLTNTMRVIGRHKVLLVVGILIAALAAFATAFRIETGTLTPRAEPDYRASTQLLVSDPTSVFSTRGAPQTVTDGQTPASARDLSSLTVVYAYLVSSGEILDEVEKEIGPLGANESLSAAQRTTQPTSATNTGTYRLPILEINGESTTPGRAEEISRTAAAIFEDFAAAQQDAAGVTPDTRVQLQTIRESNAAVVDGTNPALPIVAVGIGVLLAFLALIFAVDNARTTRRAAAAAAVLSPRTTTTGSPMERPAMPQTTMAYAPTSPPHEREYPAPGSPLTEPVARH
jgi:capsular polysaccharide biosynthesis protein